MPKKQSVFNGEIFNTNKNDKLQVIKYNHALDVKVRFLNTGFECATRAELIKSGLVKDLMNPNVFNVGFIGDGGASKKKNTACYNVWIGMLRRCYDDSYIEKFPTYKGCNVCSDWHNFQIFSIWFNDNYYTLNDNERIELDKDLLSKNNKTYSPDNCVFLPRSINSLIIKSDASRGECCIGVCFHSRDKKYEAGLSFHGKGKKHLGYFNTEKEAFKAYKTAKEKYIKDIALSYKESIPESAFKALMKYKVSIND